MLSAPAYKPGGFDGDHEWRILPGTAAHVRAALLSLGLGAEILLDDEDDVAAALREVDRL